MANQTFWHVSREAAIPSIREHGLIPQIGERSRQANETKPCVFLFKSWDYMEDALMNWLGEQFEDDEPLVAFRLSLPDDIARQLEHEADGFEYKCPVPIPASCIKKTMAL